MSKVSHDDKTGTGAFGLGRTMKFYLNGNDIGYWFCEWPLKSEHGTFFPNKYLIGLLGNKSYVGGDIWNVKNKLQQHIKDLENE